MKVEGGKYEFFQKEDGSLHADRYGEEWLKIDAGSKAILAMMQELEAVRELAEGQATTIDCLKIMQKDLVEAVESEELAKRQERIATQRSENAVGKHGLACYGPDHAAAGPVVGGEADADGSGGSNLGVGRADGEPRGTESRISCWMEWHERVTDLPVEIHASKSATYVVARRPLGGSISLDCEHGDDSVKRLRTLLNRVRGTQEEADGSTDT